jgi:hypothetical protein
METIIIGITLIAFEVDFILYSTGKNFGHIIKLHGAANQQQDTVGSSCPQVMENQCC